MRELVYINLTHVQKSAELVWNNWEKNFLKFPLCVILFSNNIPLTKRVRKKNLGPLINKKPIQPIVFTLATDIDRSPNFNKPLILIFKDKPPEKISF